MVACSAAILDVIVRRRHNEIPPSGVRADRCEQHPKMQSHPNRTLVSVLIEKERNDNDGASQY